MIPAINCIPPPGHLRIPHGEKRSLAIRSLIKAVIDSAYLPFGTYAVHYATANDGKAPTVRGTISLNSRMLSQTKIAFETFSNIFLGLYTCQEVKMPRRLRRDTSWDDLRTPDEVDADKRAHRGRKTRDTSWDDLRDRDDTNSEQTTDRKRQE